MPCSRLWVRAGSRSFSREDLWNFAAAKTTKARLEAAAFGEVNTWLQEEPTEFDSTSRGCRSQRGNTLLL
jgi:hypothetical protein